MTSDARFMSITIDAADPLRLASFWTALLGTGIETELGDGQYVFLAGASGVPELCLQRVPEPKTSKNRVHLDLAVDDLQAVTARVVELGGSWADGEERVFDRFTWRTLADPEGNEFDVILEG
jgi:predicted enzyme related to lactoylglutathione lyase